MPAYLYAVGRARGWKAFGHRDIYRWGFLTITYTTIRKVRIMLPEGSTARENYLPGEHASIRGNEIPGHPVTCNPFIWKSVSSKQGTGHGKG